MNYSYAYERFDIEKHVQSLKGLNLVEIIDKNNRESQIVEKMTIPRKISDRGSIERLQSKYIDELGQLGYILGTGNRPAGMNETLSNIFKPLFEDLVKQGVSSRLLEVFAT